MTIYKPALFIKSYIDSKLIIKLCFEKSLGTNISNIIDNFLLEYATGFALYDIKEYIINDRIRNKRYGHPLEVIVRFLSKYYKKTNNNEFNKILEKISNVENYKKIDVEELLKFLINLDNSLYNLLFNPADFLFVMYEIIDKFNIDISMYGKSIFYKKMLDNRFNINGIYIKSEGNSNNYTYKSNNLKKLEDCIIENSNFTDVNLNNIKGLCYEKQLLINNNIIMINLIRYDINPHIGMRFNSCNIIIPYILDLPDFVFVNNDKKKYELLFVVIYHDKKKMFSSIIKENNNKFYHYLFDKIIKVDDEYFNKNTINKACYIIYRMI